VDSTSDIPRDLASSLGITIVPLRVIFGDMTYLDGVDLDADEFYEKLASSNVLPRTSQPPVEDFRRVFKSLCGDASGILCITISSKVSGTYNSAKIAANQVEEVPIKVIDSKTVSMAFGFAAIAAAEAAREGASLEEVERVALDTLSRTDLLAFVDTLEYLQKGGRIGKAASLLGTLLQVKPLITLREGEVVPVTRTRTRSKAISALIDWAHKYKHPERIAVIWSTNEDELNTLLEGLSDLSPDREVIITKYGPVIGVHAGPGAMGVIVVNKSNED